MNRLRIAVVGSGIAGMSAAWLLSRRHEVTLIEQATRPGGHSNTVDVETADGRIPVDTGFIVYNTACYPNLIALFDHLGVPTAPTSMGFAVSLGDGAYEYSGTGAHGLFGQPANLLSLPHWRMSADILRFFRDARALVDDAEVTGISLGAWLSERGYSHAFVERHILPMGAAIWSAPATEILGFPAAAFARFFSNHGLLQVRNRPQWRTVVGGSREYVRRLFDDSAFEFLAGDGAVRVSRNAQQSDVAFASGQTRRFDRILLACHADQALSLLADASSDERRVLGTFRYSANRAVLHRDKRQMPRRRRLWASWNFIGGSRDRVSVSYWMNRLQPLRTQEDLFVTLNPARPLDAAQIVSEFEYTHPIFDSPAIEAQRDLWRLQGRRGTWFAGSYAGYGFHEDALQAGLAAAEAMGSVRRPWTVADSNGRIHLGEGWEGRPVAAAAG